MSAEVSVAIDLRIRRAFLSYRLPFVPEATGRGAGLAQ